MRRTCSESGGKNGSERGDGSIHQARQPRLDNLEEKKLSLGLFFASPGAFPSCALGQFFGLVLVRALFLREIVKKAADAGIAGPGRRPFIKLSCFLLYGTGRAPGRF